MAENMTFKWQEPEPIKRVPTLNEDNTPRLYNVKIKGMKPRTHPPEPGKTEGRTSLTWTLEVVDGPFAGDPLFAFTGDAMYKRSDNGQPSDLLRFIMAINQGKEPRPGAEVPITSLVGRLLRVEVENYKNRSGQERQKATRFYPMTAEGMAGMKAAEPETFKTNDSKSAGPWDKPGVDKPAEEIPVINLDEEEHVNTGEEEAQTW